MSEKQGRFLSQKEAALCGLRILRRELFHKDFNF